MKLNIAFDFVCPYCCYLLALLEKAENEFKLEIEFQPYELTPDTQPGKDIAHDAESCVRFARQLAPACRRIGLDILLPPSVTPRPYTRLAFEGFWVASEYGKANAYIQAVTNAYFRQDLDIGRLDVLCTLATGLGLDAAKFRAALESGTYTEKQRLVSAHTKESMQVNVVPTILTEDGTRIEGFIPSYEDFAQQLKAAAR